MVRTMRMTALLWILSLAGCGGGIPDIAPLHARPAFSGHIKLEVASGTATGRLAFDRASDHLQFALDTDGDPVSLQRATVAPAEIRAFSGADWRAPRPDEAAWFELLEALVTAPVATRWTAVGDNGYSVRIGDAETVVTLLADTGAHGQKR